MCDCIKDTEEKLRDKLTGPEFAKDFKPRNATELRFLHAKNSALMIKTGEWRLNIPYEATWKLENGKSKETIIHIMASHCPFCGKEFEVSVSIKPQAHPSNPPSYPDNITSENTTPR